MSIGNHPISCLRLVTLGLIKVWRGTWTVEETQGSWKGNKMNSGVLIITWFIFITKKSNITLNIFHTRISSGVICAHGFSLYYMKLFLLLVFHFYKLIYNCPFAQILFTLKKILIYKCTTSTTLPFERII